MKLTLEGIGGLATALAFAASIVTFVYTYTDQKKFNKDQLTAMNEGLRLQKEAAVAEQAAARAQREASAVEALGRYLESAPSENRAWAAAEAIIDMVGDDPAWEATARRALKHNDKNRWNIECELYSPKFLEFAARTFNVSRDDLCAHRNSRNDKQTGAK